ncbi:MSM1 (YGR171C) [Zygosaccharomyces parabailii]|nr:MSM1 (YGR171C) [Zygosaccharomyces parabailii]CDH15201.1 probable Methionine--tRNA ligase, mitochondrial [Zygosaccharomyces bailii ISA1307]
MFRRAVIKSRFYSQVSHITTPIFYPNAKPHLGHLYSSLISDVFHRWQLLQGNGSLFTTGTDEHGLKIQLASYKNGYKTPKEFVDRLYEDFIQLDKAFGIQYTRFIRTTDPDHTENVSKLWKLCRDNGYIYKGEHKGWYSVSDETFYPESKVVKDSSSPGRYLNTETNNEVVYHSENNYFFRLSQFRKRLITYIKEHPTFIYPEAKKIQILNELQNNPLQDLSISRPAFRLKWGISVPGDESQKIYVWFDALCNYLTSIGGVDTILDDKSNAKLLHTASEIQMPREWWINTTHVIGKDIIKFHTIYWPSFLMAAGLPLPRQVVVHSHWICNGTKMSKSLGNVVDPLLMRNCYGSDAIRWFLLENSQLEEDGDFQEDKLFHLTEMFASKWGNLINRCCGSKFNLHRAVQFYAAEKNPLKIHNNDTLQKDMDSLLGKLEKFPDFMSEKIANFQISSALRQAWSIINEANAFMQNSEPWTRQQKEQDAIIYTCMEASRILAITCQPVIPELANKFLDRIDVMKENRSASFAKVNMDSNYGIDSNDKGREVPIQRVSKRHT